MKILDIIQGSDEWQQLRLCKIGASDAPVIMNANPWKSEKDLWDEKMGKPTYVSERMKRGTELEPIAREMISSKHGLDYCPIVCQHDTYDFLIASLDGFATVHDQGDAHIIEIKCPNDETLQKLRNGTVPDYYFWQIQHQLAVTDLQECCLIGFDGVKLVEVTVHRDDEAINALIAKEVVFWAQMCNFQPPEPQLPERTDLKARQAVFDWSGLKEAHDELYEKLEAARNRVIELAAGTAFSCCGVKVTKVSKPGRINYEAIPELQSVDLEKYRKADTHYWRVG